MTNSKDLLEPLRRHPVFVLANQLAAFVGVGRDLVMLAVYLSFGGGKMSIPIHLDIATDHWAADLAIADRICSILPAEVENADTHRRFSELERNGFDGISVVRVRRDYPHLYRDVLGFTARAADSSDFAPSVVRIVPRIEGPFAAAPVLRLVTGQLGRDLTGFGAAFASTTGDPRLRNRLASVLESLACRTFYPCPFRGEFIGSVDPVSMLIVERLLQVFVAMRRVLTDFATPPAVTPQDFEAVRAFLVGLPLAPADRTLSSGALTTAERIHAEVDQDAYQLALPDRSAEGHKWFTRGHASGWTGLGYTTVKKHLQELEDDGVLLSAVDRNNREHGRVIHFRFADVRVPPFAWRNPFDRLPVFDPT